MVMRIKNLALLGTVLVGLSMNQLAEARPGAKPVDVVVPKVGSIRYADHLFNGLRKTHGIPETTALEHLAPERIEEISKSLNPEDAKALRSQYEIRSLMAKARISNQMRANLGLGATIHGDAKVAGGSAAGADATKGVSAASESLAGSIAPASMKGYFTALDNVLGKPGEAQKIWAEFQKAATAKGRAKEMSNPETVAALLSLIDQSAREGKAVDGKALASEVFGENLGPAEIMKLTALKDEAYAEVSKTFEGITVKNAAQKFEQVGKELADFEAKMSKDTANYSAEDIAAYKAQVKRYNDQVAKFKVSGLESDMRLAQNYAEGLLYARKLDASNKFEQAKLCFHCPC